MYTIQFRFGASHNRDVMIKGVFAGYNLLELALRNNIPLDHDCGGICACTTCHVYIEKGMTFFEEMNTREYHFINRTVAQQPHSRLACQSLLLDGKGSIEVTIPGTGKQEIQP